MESCGPFTLAGSVGAGSLFEVHRGVRINEGRYGAQYAVKRVLEILDIETEFTTAIRTLGTAAVALNHPNVVRTFDAGTEPPRDMTTPGRTWVAQEFVVGKPLNAVLNQIRTGSKDIPRNLTFTVVTQVLNGLAYAHAAKGPQGQPLGIIHGDIAPANVFVTSDGNIKLSDFCINRARIVLRHNANAHLRARFHYLAPETARTGAVDQRSDLYAVGIMLHEMLAARRLRRGQTPEELLQQAQTGVWPALETLGVATDAELNAILGRALHEDPAQRVQTADELLRLVNNYASKNNLLLTSLDVMGLLNAQFPTLQSAETVGRAQVDAVFDSLQGTNTAAPLGNAKPAPVVEPEPEKPKPKRAPVKVGGGLSQKTLLTGVGALLVVGAVGAGVSTMMNRRGDDENRHVSLEPQRDLSRLVGGRTVLSWQERLTAIDKAITEAQKTEPDGPAVQQLKALREDTIRKAQALGLKELGK